MNYTYDNQPPNQQNPQQGYVIQFGPPTQQQPQPKLPEQMYQLTLTEQQAFTMARLSGVLADVRMEEAKLLLAGMNEMRSALDTRSLTVGQNDKGSGDRPPLEPAFNDVNRGRIQNAYVRMVERYVNYVEHFLDHDLKIDLTNEIKKDDGLPK